MIFPSTKGYAPNGIVIPRLIKNDIICTGILHKLLKNVLIVLIGEEYMYMINYTKHHPI